MRTPHASPPSLQAVTGPVHPDTVTRRRAFASVKGPEALSSAEIHADGPFSNSRRSLIAGCERLWPIPALRRAAPVRSGRAVPDPRRVGTIRAGPGLPEGLPVTARSGLPGRLGRHRGTVDRDLGRYRPVGLDVDHGELAGVALGEGRAGPVSREHVRVAVAAEGRVRGVGVVPGAGGQLHHAGPDVLGERDAGQAAAAVVEQADNGLVNDAPCG